MSNNGFTTATSVLRYFWDKLVYKSFYIANIGLIRLRLLELQDNNIETKQLRSKKLLKNWKNIDGVLYYKSFSYICEIIYFELISRCYDNLLISHFRIHKT